MRESLARRVTDGVVRRLIDKWLKAGVLESGQIHYPDTGTPQGSVVSPILSNVVLHDVIDEWFTQQVQPRLRGPSTLVRFCDDFVTLFAHREDAERVQAVLGKRLGRFGLQLHPDKTRLVDFRPDGRPAVPGESTLPTTFTFVGFVHVWGTSQKGHRVVRQYTAKERLARSLKALVPAVGPTIVQEQFELGAVRTGARAPAFASPTDHPPLCHAVSEPVQ